MRSRAARFAERRPLGWLGFAESARVQSMKDKSPETAGDRKASALPRAVTDELAQRRKDAARADDIRENTQRVTSTLEQMIRLHPDHWNWIHRRWKTRPEGEQRFY